MRRTGSAIGNSSECLRASKGFVRPGTDSVVKLPSEVWVSKREDAASAASLFRLGGRFVFRCARAAAQFADSSRRAIRAGERRGPGGPDGEFP